MIVPFGYFFWKSLTLRVGDTWPMFMWPIGFAAAAINIAMLPREGRPAWMIKSTAHGRTRRLCPVSSSSSWFSLFCRRPWNFFGRADPIGGEAGYEQVVDRAQAELQKIGATWIATTDYRTYAMLRWFFNGRVPVIQINERGRFLGFHDPGMNLIRGHTGLYVGREPDNANPFWAATTAIREPLERVERIWRGRVMDTYALEKLTGWTPQLSPPPTRRFRLARAGGRCQNVARWTSSFRPDFARGFGFKKPPNGRSPKSDSKERDFDHGRAS